VNNFRSSQQVETWVIYRSLSKGVGEGAHAVCAQADWDRMEQSSPGRQVLIQAGIVNEATAERLARGTRGDPVPKKSTGKFTPLVTAPPEAR
jgi:hypothetical protein